MCVFSAPAFSFLLYLALSWSLWLYLALFGPDVVDMVGQNESIMAIGNEVRACSQRQVQPVAFSSLPSIRSIPVTLEILIADDEEEEISVV